VTKGGRARGSYDARHRSASSRSATGSKPVRTATAAVCLIGIVAALLALAAPADAKARRTAQWRCGDTRFIAHRGSVDRTRVENTIRSFGHAAYAGARTIETDLQLTADHRWVVMHDASVDRTTTGTGRVSQLTLAQVKGLRTNDGVLGGVPTFSQTLAYLRSKPALRLEVEIKDVGADDTAVRIFSSLVHHYGVAERVRVTSIGLPLLTRLHAIDPTLHRAVITDQGPAFNHYCWYGA
jgi:glycerophosphoryl diester phosphodiesterase